MNARADKIVAAALRYDAAKKEVAAALEELERVTGMQVFVPVPSPPRAEVAPATKAKKSAPEKAPTKAAEKLRDDKPDLSGMRLIVFDCMQAAEPSKVWTAPEIVKRIKRSSDNAVGQVLTQLASEGRITRIARGRYSIGAAAPAAETSTSSSTDTADLGLRLQKNMDAVLGALEDGPKHVGAIVAATDLEEGVVFAALTKLRAAKRVMKDDVEGWRIAA